jgi:hypothetical protein
MLYKRSASGEPSAFTGGVEVQAENKTPVIRKESAAFRTML